MKKITLSLAMIVLVGAAVASGTGAFFSDSETSTGNTFTAGAIDLKVDSTSHYAGLICANNDGYRWSLENPQGTTTRPDLLGQTCSGSWALKDLVPGQDKFFNFSDVKPGDQGENTISLHIDNNSAYACADVTNVQNNDNSNLTPEVVAGDVTPGPIGGGELGANLDFLVWNDNGAGANAGNNVWDADEVGTNTSGGAPATNTAYTLADSSGLPIPPTATSYLGLAWCAGTFTAGGPGVAPVCDGSSMGNQSQTDSYIADIGIRVVQSRNNANFTCGAPVVGVPAPTVVGANDLETVLANSAVSGKWYFYDDSSDVLNNALGSFVAGPSIPPLGAGSALVNPLASASGRTLFTNGGFGGTVLASTTALSYGYYQPSGAWSSTEAPFLRFNVDFAGSASYQGSLVYVPSANGAVTQDSWQSTGNITTAGALWSYSGANWPVGVNTAVPFPGTTLRTWASILADYPAIRMHPLFPQIGVRVGEPGPTGLTANLDNFSITVNAVTKTYNFGN